MDNGTRCYHRFLEGDEGALEEIVDLYNRKLILFINHLVNNLSDAEDLAAEAFLDLILMKPRFREKSSFKTYVLGEVDWNEELKALLRALNELRPDYRDVLHLLYFEEMSYREAATVLKKSAKQINNLAFRAKNAMRAAMQREVT